MDRLQFEILCSVAQFLSQDQRALLSMNQTCHKFHEASSPYLYHTPRFCTLRQVELFERQLSASQAQHVRALDLQLVPHRWSNNIGPLLVSLTAKATRIEHLDLALCRLDGRHLIAATAALPQLKYLSVHKCQRPVGDHEMQAVARQCPYLQELDLATSHVTDVSIRAIATHCSLLEVLDISECDQVSEDGLRYLAQHCKKLRYVSIKDCYNILPDAEDFEALPDTVEWVSNESDEDEAQEDDETEDR